MAMRAPRVLDDPADWWTPEGAPTVALLAWTHERRYLHKASAVTCPSCREYRLRFGPPPGETTWKHCASRLRRGAYDDARPIQRLAQVARKELTAGLWWDILERDDFRCQHCGVRRFLTVDHIVALDNGGTNDPINLQTLCRSCNSIKGNR